MCFKHFVSIEFKVESVWKNYIIQIRSTDLTYGLQLHSFLIGDLSFSVSVTYDTYFLD